MQREPHIAPATRLARVAAAAIIVLGILGMHALSLHPTTHEPAPMDVPIATSVAAATDAMYASFDAEMGPAGGAEDGGGAGHSPGDMVMLCVAMIVAAASLLAILCLLQRVPRFWAVLHPIATLRITRRVAPTGTGPPPVWQFSVIRC